MKKLYFVLFFVVTILLGCSNSRYELYENNDGSIFWEEANTKIDISLRGKDKSWGVLFFFDMIRFGSPYTVKIMIYPEDNKKRYDRINVLSAELITDSGEKYVLQDIDDKPLMKEVEKIGGHYLAKHSFEPSININFEKVKQCIVSITLQIEHENRSFVNSFRMVFARNLKKETHLFPDYGSV